MSKHKTRKDSYDAKLETIRRKNIRKFKSGLAHSQVLPGGVNKKSVKS